MKDNTYYIGIDPGVNGGIAILHSDGDRIMPIPMLKDDVINAEKVIRDIPFNSLDYYAIAYIEKVWKPSKLVRIAGVLEGIILSVSIPVYRVAPSTWRKEILGNNHATKENAINYCLENYPDINLLRTERSRVPDHNLAEALCIAEYAKKKHFISENQR